ncbi:MAG: ABC transporter permease subunit [Anaerolineales bacterium]|jgi:ABC-2 type transport system permease protein|uniref:ABC transporter permease n=1 Tax=Candidatus Villigracilis affinis TaxID=3140682 RepID=UPI001B442741|nr:ABC transporter permease subunit [Anaerolineales bacterium]MBK9601202.1 ABC transporter permease subunit [Anaerolineales bacterium]MBL0347593.1 ABC transporter permease subunit [Anaerolineales bacterium]MBP8047324.1 ABC transporter permease subunit [Anaerolineales bacterium]
MRTIWTIAKREYDNYFNSPLAYVVAFSIVLPVGIYFSLIMYVSAQQSMMGGPPPDSTPINWLFVFLMIFLSPALTMRLLSDEARMGTLELLLTAPVRDFELVAGKFLGAFLFVLTIALFTLIFPIIINNFVTPGIDWKVIIASYIGLVLVCGALLALGTGISAIFTNQFAAFFVTFGLFFFLWFMVNLPANYLQQGGDVYNYLSLSQHFSSMNRGTIALGDIVYYISLIALGLFAGTTAIEIRRWR